MSIGLCFIYLMTLTILILSSFVDRDMVMCYHWGLGVGHVYSHSDCAGNGIIQNQTADGEHEQEADEQDEGVYCSTSDTRGGGEEETLASDFDNDSHEGSDSGSVESSGDVDDIVDYQN